MIGRAPKVSSGIDSVDRAWGGLYLGGSYLVYGRAASGRRLIPILLARAAASAGERSLLIRSDEPKVRPEESAYIESEMHGLAASGLLDTAQLSQFGVSADADDNLLEQAVLRLVATAEDVRPARVIVDDFMPFARFHSFRRFRTTFITMLERVDAIDATLVLFMAEPANEPSEQVIEFMRSQMTAAVHATQAEDSTLRSLKLIPNIGHVGAQTEVQWDVREMVKAEAASHHPGRRFRFAEDFSDDVSPLDAEWDVSETFPDHGGDHVRPDSIPAIRPASIDVSAQKSVTAYQLGRQERTGPHVEKSRRTPTAIPLGRARLRGSQEAGASEHQAADSREAGTPEHRPADARETGTPEHRAAGSQEAGSAEHRAARHREIYRTTSRADVSGVALPRDPEEPIHTVTSHSDRDAFRSRLQQHFLRNNVNGSSFLLIAMRMERSSRDEARPFDFEFILDLVSELLRDEDDVYVDLERERLVVLLADRRPEDSQQFFAHLKKRLREESPSQSEVLLKSVSAIVVPDGEPFQNAEEFLTYALDEG